MCAGFVAISWLTGAIQLRVKLRILFDVPQQWAKVIKPVQFNLRLIHLFRDRVEEFIRLVAEIAYDH